MEKKRKHWGRKKNVEGKDEILEKKGKYWGKRKKIWRRK